MFRGSSWVLGFGPVWNAPLLLAVRLARRLLLALPPPQCSLLLSVAPPLLRLAVQGLRVARWVA